MTPYWSLYSVLTVTVTVGVTWRLPAAALLGPNGHCNGQSKVTHTSYFSRRFTVCFTEWALGRVNFSLFFSLCLCWFVSWLLTISGSFLWRGAPMQSKLPAAALTQQSRFGTRNLEIASRRWGGTRGCKFFFNSFLVSASRPWPATGKSEFFYQYDRTITQEKMFLFWVPVR